MRENAPELDQPPACPECGKWLSAKSLAMPCEQCLNKRYLKEMLIQEEAAWVKVPFLEVELTRGPKGGLMHLVLKVDFAFTYCGTRAVGPRNRRMRVRLNDLPGGACTACLGNFQRVQQSAAAERRREGVHS